nr:hypothetical protein [Tanacetum cinerariifolium]
VKQSEEGIFISQDKYVVKILEKFDFSSVRTASTPIETHKPLVKDKEAVDVDVHLYRSMIRSLMYLTASRPDIMFAVCACSRFQVTPKLSHLHAVKRTFRRLISWQCKKQTIVTTCTTEADCISEGEAVDMIWRCLRDGMMFDLGKKLVLQSKVSAVGLPLEKVLLGTEGNVEFHQIVDFLKSRSIHHALTPNPQGEGSGSGPGCQETMGCAMAQIRPKGAPIQSSDPPLSKGNTIGSGEDRMEHAIELTNPIPQTPHDSPFSRVKTAQAKEIASLQKRVTKLEQIQSSRISSFHPFRDGTSMIHNLGRRNVSKQGRNTLKSQQKFQDIDDLVDEEVIVEDKGSGEKGGSTAKTVSTARPDNSAARLEVSTTKTKTPPITTTISITTLQPLPTVDLKDKGKGILQEPKPVKKTKKRDQDQIKRDVEVALKIQADLDEEVKTERERQEEASKAALAELYDKVQAQIDADHELAARLTHKEQEKYTVKESFEEIQKLFTKEQKWVDAFVPIGSEEDEKRVRSKKKRAASSSSKQKSPKKKKVNDQESINSDKELRKCLKVVPDDDKAINYETLDVKSPIVDCADNRPPMLEKDMYDSWKSIMELYMLKHPHGRMILESVEQCPLIWPSVEVEGVTRLKKYLELSAAEAIQADCDVKATNIILQGLPPETPNDLGFQGTSSGDGPRCQETMEDTVAQNSSERVSKISNDQLLVGVNTP